MLVYISGKIGEEVISEATRQKFMKAQEMLLEKGYTIINPASEKFQKGMKKEVDFEEKKWKKLRHGKFDRYAWILLYDLHFLALCDAVYFLEDWDKSPGAGAEHSFALASKKEMLWQRLEDAQIYRDDNQAAEEVWLPLQEI